MILLLVESWVVLDMFSALGLVMITMLGYQRLVIRIALVGIPLVSIHSKVYKRDRLEYAYLTYVDN